MAEKSHRAGFVAIVGRPNVGKSTLLNRYAGERLAIVSPKPQTTRNRIMGVVTRPDFQIAFLDTPGIHRAKGELNRHMVDVALQAMSEVDAILFMVEAAVGAAGKVEIGEANRFILDRLRAAHKPVVLAVNKVDVVPRLALLPIIDAYRQVLAFDEVFPISATLGDGTEPLLVALGGLMPESPNLYPEDVVTDQAERALAAEYIREKVLRFCRQEIPYSAAVVVEEFDESERAEEGAGERLQGLVRIMATIFVERESQKAIVIGKGGAMLKKIGTEARHDIERLLGAHVYLALTVRVEPGWSERPDALQKLGYVR